jgi:hypothetical protein
MKLQKNLRNSFAGETESYSPFSGKRGHFPG